MKWLHEYDRHGNLKGGIFQPRHKPMGYTVMQEHQLVKWRLVASWPRNTWFQERRRYVVICELESEG